MMFVSKGYFHSKNCLREAQCTVAPTPPGQLVRSVSTMAEEEGRYKTTMRIIWRCLQLFFLLAPVLATLPLLRHPAHDLLAAAAPPIPSTLSPCPVRSPRGLNTSTTPKRSTRTRGNRWG